MLFPNLLLATVFFFLSAIHIYWTFGGKWGHSNAIPTDREGNYLFSPGKGVTIFVAIGLAFFGIFYFNNTPFIQLNWPERVNSIGAWVIPSIFTLRAIGDFRYVGAFKRVKDTEFGEMDSKFFSPLCFIIGIIGFYLLINS
ncbi:MAG: hypothetical protein CMB80_22315 [Flammeovirgaceae bacterium]|nr:hypothetical protein [Flammeovirgaceae bacterium]MBE62646.1 hypothetical protein [Flammeovirgaceae bacterium]MBR09845.1 hypothetical protein [Rickettsiales bacterium]|tara:strand:- start:1943 stop:2365 length:423 start_codon:yes stop_codon:yes gene_type:complete